MEIRFGKTIIFAKNHNHAERIVKIFNDLYPEYKGQFTKLIDNKVEYHEDLIEHFGIKDDYPQIAVSVDMLDTGVDIPEILNLVFFKPVKSKIKFWQMIGRGTRLCKDLFGVGQDKKEFYIFDYCNNFQFFSENPKGIETNSKISLTEKIYEYKLDLIVELQNMKYANEDYRTYREELIEDFISQINKLNKDSFMVKAKAHYIEQFCKKENWIHISIIDLADIKENLIPLFIPTDENEEAKRFDNMLYCLQVRKMKQYRTKKYEDNIINIVSELEKLGGLPLVKQKQELILKVSETDYIREADFWNIEKIRKELRDLIQYIEPSRRYIPIDTDFEDNLHEIDEEYTPVDSGYNFTNYKKKLEKFITSNLENSIIWKIKHNLRLTEAEKQNLEKILFEELGSNKEYAQTYGDTNIIKAVRNIVGLDKNVVNDIFYKYINDNRLNIKQIHFVKLLVDYVMRNGTIDMQTLTEQPFNTVGQVYELFGNDIDLFKQIKQDIDIINENAEKLA